MKKLTCQNATNNAADSDDKFVDEGATVEIHVDDQRRTLILYLEDDQELNAISVVELLRDTALEIEAGEIDPFKSWVQ